jgi:hypothetical protein
MAIFAKLSKAWKSFFAKRKVRENRSKSSKPSTFPYIPYRRSRSGPVRRLLHSPTDKNFDVVLGRIRIDWSWLSFADKTIARILYHLSHSPFADISEIFPAIQNWPRSDSGENDIAGPNSELQGQLEKVQKLKTLRWVDDTIILYLKLSRRGFEPLFPSTWKLDFPLFPDNLFYSPDVEKRAAFVHAISGSEFRGRISNRSSFVSSSSSTSLTLF